MRMQLFDGSAAFGLLPGKFKGKDVIHLMAIFKFEGKDVAVPIGQMYDEKDMEKIETYMGDDNE